jgi:hypothetical protein
MSVVYVVQNPLRYDSERGQLIPRYDVTSASSFGRLKFLPTARGAILDPQEAVRKLDSVLRHFSDEDHLLLIGNPVLIGWATALAASHNDGRVSLLVWSGREKAYRAVKSVLPVSYTSL